jgi:hypothetical protein
LLELDERHGRSGIAVQAARWVSKRLLTRRRAVGNTRGDDTTTGMIRPIEVIYKKLTKAMRVTYENIENGIWTTVEGQHYLSENAINVELSDKIVSNAKNCFLLQHAYENATEDLDEWEQLSEDNKNFPEKYTAPQSPAVWDRDIPLRIYIDTPMHLLYLGIVKAVFVYVGIWSNRSLWAPSSVSGYRQEKATTIR